MASRIRIPVVTCAAIAVVFAAAPAAADVIGTFRWRTEPYCNVLSLTVVRQGGVYQLNGVDDLCGAGSAPVTGTATLTASAIALGFTVATLAGRPAYISAAVAPGTFHGTWMDGDGNGGAFTFNPAGASGSPRPGPIGRVLSATVSSGGLLLRGIGAVAASRTGSTYQVLFNRDISACAVAASVGSRVANSFNVMFAATAPVASTPRAVAVVGFSFNGSPSLIDFHLVVVCP
jgi:hypothetical protein